MNAFTEFTTMLALLSAVSLATSGWMPGIGIQRTMRLLATSTPAKPNRVKILFYGQSITKQEWWRTVEANLRSRFPSAALTVENRAIGGFAADRLKRTVIHDVFASYPDLIILHDYGGEPDYEQLIQTIRSNVASEVLVQSDHVAWTGKTGEPPPHGEIWHDAHVGWLRRLAERYRMGFVDVRTPWRAFLTEHNLPASSLLKDGIHLNDKGCALMASLISSALVYDARLPEDKGLVRAVPAKSDLSFEGNRVDIVAGKGSLSVEIDGKPPSQHSELIGFDRPSDGFGIDVPALARVDSMAKRVAQEWTLTLSDISADVSRWRFRVEGSVAGEDGEGSSASPFVSRSGQVAIDPRDWYVHEAFQISHQKPPEGFQCRWSATLRGADRVEPNATVTAANGLGAGRHKLSLVGEIKGARVVIYRPPFSASGQSKT